MEFNDKMTDKILIPPHPSAAFAGKQVLLASQSPRRRELLSMILPGFKITQIMNIEESFPHDLPAEMVAEYLSKVKAAAYDSVIQEDELIITADTIVIAEGLILGKPKDENSAIKMLKQLRGRQHMVVTGVTISTTKSKVSFSEKTLVTFDDISDEEICRYVEFYKPLDKAGAYGIQEWIGAIGIKGIEGCFYNVMGLPLHSLYQHLKSYT